MTLQEPNYYLTDSSGNRIGAIGVDSNGNPVVEHVDSGQQVAVTADGLEAAAGSFNSLSTAALQTENSSTVAILTSNQTLPNDTFTKVQFDGTEINQIGFDSSNNHVPVPETGTYSISLQIRIAGGIIDEELTTRILVNGSAIGENRVDGTDLGTPTTQATPTVDVELDSGDEIAADVRQANSNNADRQIFGVNLPYTFLRVRRV